MKRTRLMFAFVLVMTLVFNLSGCGLLARLQEDKMYTQKINAFFDALDQGDAAAIKSLFSQTVLHDDTDLDEQIDRLIEVYPRATTAVMFNGLLAKTYEKDAGKYKSTMYANFPVISNHEYYWAHIELVQQDEFYPDNIGLSRVFFYTADEYCILFHDDRKFPSDLGLLVYAEQKLENEVRCINMYPYEFVPIERDLKVSEVEAFLQECTDFAAFTSRFGQPNAEGDLWAYYYEILDADGASNYLEVFVIDGVITSFSLLSEFDYIRSIYKQQDN